MDAINFDAVVIGAGPAGGVLAKCLADRGLGVERNLSMRLLLRFFGFLFAAGTIVFLVGVAGVAGLIWHFSKDLPDYSQLQDYEPPVMTRVHATDGSLVAEYATQRRLYLPIQAWIGR